ncbi:MAG: (d)CMP kinase [Desulfobacteraceae bacterium]|nr:(d)CMP kinase [Desulfobacteraceae bacterium]
MRPLLITIDGPAGAGKTTISRELSDLLGYRYLDTGALYRGVALKFKQFGVSLEDADGLSRLLQRLEFKLKIVDSGMRLICNDTDITDAIRMPEISMLASAVSAKPVVRDFLMEIQRNIGRQKSIVAEGRDMGTVVFPDADIKFFLNASLKTRALRRFNEHLGVSTQSLEEVETEMHHRDTNDSTRILAPLKPAPEAHIIDSTQLNPHQVVEKMLTIIIDYNSR